MADAASIPSSLSPRTVYRWGGAILHALLAGLTLLILGLAWAAPELLPFVPAVLLSVVALAYLVKHPLLNLSVVLGGFIVVSMPSDGLQIPEIAYGLYYLSYLGLWFALRFFVEHRRILDQPEAVAVFTFMVLATLSAPLTVLFDGELRLLFSEWVALTMLLLYFPIREGFVRYPSFPKIVLGLILALGVMAALRNLWLYYSALSDATQAWQIARGRVATNDALLMIASITGLAVLIHADRWHHRILLFGVFLAVFAGLILTQSRAFWVTFVLGVALLFVLESWRYRLRLLSFTAVGLVGTASVGFLVAPDYMILIASGLIERASSLGTATTRDLSLVNRFYESAATWSYIVKNPILGYGMGVPYRFFDLTVEATEVESFVHNGYLSLWYRFGIWGLGCVMILWWGAAWRGFLALRASGPHSILRLCSLSAVINLVIYSIPAITSNPFHRNDGTFLVALLTGIAGGAFAALHHSPTSSESAPA